MNIAWCLLLSFISAAPTGFVIHAVTYFPQTIPALTKTKHIHAFTRSISVMLICLHYRLRENHHYNFMPGIF